MLLCAVAVFWSRMALLLLLQAEPIPSSLVPSTTGSPLTALQRSTWSQPSSAAVRGWVCLNDRSTESSLPSFQEIQPFPASASYFSGGPLVVSSSPVLQKVKPCSPVSFPGCDLAKLNHKEFFNFTSNPLNLTFSTFLVFVYHHWTYILPSSFITSFSCPTTFWCNSPFLLSWQNSSPRMR